jgi:hypothetical protein
LTWVAKLRSFEFRASPATPAVPYLSIQRTESAMEQKGVKNAYDP